MWDSYPDGDGGLVPLRGPAAAAMLNHELSHGYLHEMGGGGIGMEVSDEKSPSKSQMRRFFEGKSRRTVGYQWQARSGLLDLATPGGRGRSGRGSRGFRRLEAAGRKRESA